MKKQSVVLKMAALVLTGIMTASALTGCGTGKDSGAPAPGTAGAETSTAGPVDDDSRKVVVGLANDPQNIGPFQGMSAGRIGILYTTYEFLVTTEGGEMYGVLMKDYEKVDDLTYNCEIYDYIHDQAGNQVTAADIVFSYETGIASGNLPKLGSIDSVEAISDYVVQFKFNKLAIGDLGALWMECPIVTQAAYEASADKMATDPVSTTAYQCTEFVSGSKIVFTNTGNYWQTDTGKIRKTSKAHVDAIEFNIITDGSQLTNALKTNAIDVTNWLSDVDVADFKDLAGFDVTPVPDNASYFLVYNCDAENGVFADNLKYRQAIAYAIDSQQLVDGALSGSGNALKTWGNTNYSDYLDQWLEEDYYDTDPGQAKQLLAEAGVTGGKLNLMAQSGDVNTKLATIIQAQLGQIGVEVEINTYDAQLYNEYKYTPDKWDIMLDQAASTSFLVNVWKLNWDNSGYVHGGAVNFVKDAKLQQMMETAMDMEQHTDANMDAFHQYLKEQCYGLGLVQNMSNIAHTDKITEIVVDARGQVIAGACTYSVP